MSQDVDNLPNDDEIRQAIFQPFECVRRLAPEQLLDALVPNERDDKYKIIHMPYAPHEEMGETCDFVNGFNLFLDKTDSAHMQMRIKLSIYCHIMEADYPFAVLWNLLRILNGLPCQWTIKRLGKPCEYPKDKILALKELAEPLHLPTGEILYKLWNGDIRNRFNHSQYSLEGDLFMGTKNVSPFSRKDNKSFASLDIRYSFQYIDTLYTRSWRFLRLFVDAYKGYIAPFQDGTAHKVQNGEIIWKPPYRWVWILPTSSDPATPTNL